MPNVNAVLAQEIARLSKRVLNTSTHVTRRLVARHRRDLAALKRQVADLTRRLALAEKRQPKRIAPPPEVAEKARFRAVGVKAHRAKLGLSAAEYAKLVGVSALTIYHWEGGKARPRNKETAARWLAIRGLGKREALERLGMAEPKAGSTAKAAPRQGKRGTFQQTGTEMILALLRRRGLFTAAINAAWKQEGRKGTADVTLGDLVRARRLRREKVRGKRGSRYSMR